MSDATPGWDTVPNTKIVCTLGPASDSRDTIEALADAGMAVARFNASHGGTDDRATLIERVQTVDSTGERSVATLLDLAGPEIRTAPLEGSIDLVDGSTVEFVAGTDATPERVGLSVSLDTVQAGDRVLLDDGRIETVVESVDGTVRARVESGGELGGRTGVNVPGVELGLDALTDADERELDMGVAAGVDFVAASFVGSDADVYAVTEAIESRGGDIPVVAKIERADAVENIDAIIRAADGIMVARGDLGVECPMEAVPLIQKRIIHRCRTAGVPVITATEMLDSMTHARRPTRAETTDVANAVFDGTDAVMLSAETAIGDHPVRVVETMARLVREVEHSAEYDEALEASVPQPGESRTDVLARAARYLARDVDAAAIIAATESGYTGLKAAKYRPGVPVVAVTPDDQVRRRLSLSAGVVARHAPLTGPAESGDAVIENAVQTAIEAGVADSGETVVVLAGMMTDLEGANTTNTLKLHVAAETVASGRSVVAGRATGPIHRLTDGDLTAAPDGAVVVLPDGFDDEFTGDPETVAGIISPHEGVTSYAAIIARELGISMVAGVSLPAHVTGVVTLDAGRGVVYEGRVGDPDRNIE